MIDFQKLADSVKYYEERGFTRIESPWTVSKAASAITKPAEALDYELVHNGKVLVASGEQSFLYLYMKGFLPLGRYQTITPCFRNDAFDVTHSKYFMKNELIITDEVNEDELLNVVDICRRFFQQYIPGKVERVETPQGYDLEYAGRELGSYGIRQCEFITWIYATGCAEPRLSTLSKCAL